MKRLLLAAAALLSLAACATPTPYQPLQTASRNVSSGGYSDFKISADRYRVTFQGNTLTDRETVERYLLYRAAELTRQEGYDWFTMADRNTEADRRRYVHSSDPFGYGAWQPTWYYLGRGQWTVINTYNPFYRPDYYTQTVQQYRATAEIFLGKGEKPANDSKAFNAAEVISNLGPTLRLPAAV